MAKKFPNGYLPPDYYEPNIGHKIHSEYLRSQGYLKASFEDSKTPNPVIEDVFCPTSQNLSWIAKRLGVEEKWVYVLASSRVATEKQVEEALRYVDGACVLRIREKNKPKGSG